MGLYYYFETIYIFTLYVVLYFLDKFLISILKKITRVKKLNTSPRQSKVVLFAIVERCNVRSTRTVYMPCTVTRDSTYAGTL